MTLQAGVRVLNASCLVYVGLDRNGYYFTFDSAGQGKPIRLVQKSGSNQYEYRLGSAGQIQQAKSFMTLRITN